MSVWGYEVRRITLENYAAVAADLQAALASHQEDGFELVSCFPEQRHDGGPIHETRTGDQGSGPYDDIWHAPSGPVFMAVFKHQRSE